VLVQPDNSLLDVALEVGSGRSLKCPL